MKRIASLLSTLLCVVAAIANPVSRQQARQQALQFMQQRGVQLQGEVVNTKIRKTQAADQPLYVFNAGDGQGFVVVSGDDRTDAILGYTLQGSYDEANMPPALTTWLQQMAAEIEALGPEVAGARRAADEPKATEVPLHMAIKPLILTTWNQGNNSYSLENTDGIYNISCPQIQQKVMVGEEVKDVMRYPCTGCEAVAAAQLMYYYQYPKELTLAVPGYERSGSKADTSEDLPAIKFQWDKMKTSYSSSDAYTDEARAVADLMVYCGYAAEMNYAIDGSGTDSGSMASGLAKYFDYDPNTWDWPNRSDYTIIEWDQLIYNELANGRPVIYEGTTDTGSGHAFICDGYDGAGYYHFNWGWGGLYNGYYKLQATNPHEGEGEVGYIFDQACIVGLQPNTHKPYADPSGDDDWEEPEEITDIVATAINIVVNDDMTITMGMSNRNDDKYGFGIGMGEINGDGTITVVNKDFESRKNTKLNKNSYWPDLLFVPVRYGLEDGVHKLVSMSLLSTETTWRRCKPANLWFDVEIKDGKVTSIVKHPIESLKINKFNMVSGGIPGHSQSFIVNVTNEGDNKEYSLYLYVDDKYASWQTLKIAAGNTKEFFLQTGKLEEGKHVVTLRNGYGGEILETIDVEIAQDLEATAMVVSGNKFTGTMLSVDATVENHAGDYNVPLYLFASLDADAKGSYQYVAGSAVVGGGSEDIRFYFVPSKEGEWNLWVATDEKGEEVIGHSTVDIAAIPTGDVKLQLTNRQIICERDGYMTYKMTVKNVGETTNYRNITSHLWYPKGGGMWSWEGSFDANTPTVVIEPGQEVTTSMTFHGLTNGSTYTIDPRYATTYEATTWQGFYTNWWDEEFTYKEPAMGDVNGDGIVNVVDVTSTISHILGQKPAGFAASAADIDGNGVVNVVDVTTIIDMILKAGSSD